METGYSIKTPSKLTLNSVVRDKVVESKTSLASPLTLITQCMVSLDKELHNISLTMLIYTLIHPMQENFQLTLQAIITKVRRLRK
jgi:hypothetical protein